jgi:glycosyltransferase involved in cell wall biosynthesis
MKIIWLTKLTDNDTFRNTQLMISDALRKQDHEVTLVLARHFTEKKEKQKEILYLPTLNVKIVSGLVFGFIVFLSLYRLLKNKKVDIIIVSGDTIWSPFLLFIKIFRIPLILDIRSLPIDTDTIKLKNISLYLSRYLTDGLTTITPELADVLKKRYHLQDKKIGIWSSGFSKNQFNELQENVKKNHMNDKFVLLHHGSYSPSRGIEELIRSIPLVDEPLKEKIKLILVGIPKNKIEEIEHLCKSLNISDQVEIIPPVDIEKIPVYIQSCDVGIIPLPTDNEWWRVSVPLKTLEFLAMGKPIIATNIPFHQKIFNLCNCGILLNTNNPNEIAKAINLLYQSKEKLHDMGQKGREIVEKYYSWESKGIELEEFLRQFL